MRARPLWNESVFVQRASDTIGLLQIFESVKDYRYEWFVKIVIVKWLCIIIWCVSIGVYDNLEYTFCLGGTTYHHRRRSTRPEVRSAEHNQRTRPGAPRRRGFPWVTGTWCIGRFKIKQVFNASCNLWVECNETSEKTRRASRLEVRTQKWACMRECITSNEQARVKNDKRLDCTK